VLSWAQIHLHHNCAESLDEWAQALASGDGDQETVESILSRVHHIDQEAWRALARHLDRGPVRVQRVLLESLYWLLYHGQVPGDERIALQSTLRQLAQSEDTDLRTTALWCMSFIEAPTPDDYALLEAAFDGPHAATAARALATTAADQPPEVQARAEARLLDRLNRDIDPALAHAVAGAVAYLWIKPLSIKADAWDLNPTLDRLADLLDDQPEEMLASLLAAGTDEIPWDDYHDRITKVLQTLLSTRSDLLETFLESYLPQALVQPDWPERRIALAAAAASAEVAPAVFAQVADPDILARQFVEAVTDVESFSARRFALTSLGHLRRVTPDVIGALWNALRDVSQVQQDALRAVLNFRRVEGDLIPQLAEGLMNESAAFAYATGQVLAALGRSESTTAAQRQAIVDALAEAVRSPASQREVYVLEDRSIHHLGRLDRAFHQALLQVAEGVR
jgi:hypothetical protein